MDFPFNHTMFPFAQFKLAENYQDSEEYKSMKIRFHVVLEYKEEEVWSLVKIIKLVSITPDVIFEGVVQNYRYKVVRANYTLYKFTIVDFPLMNLNDLITVTKIMGDMNNDRVQDKASYIIRYSHIKSFVCYYAHLSLTDFEFPTTFNKKLKVPMSIFKGNLNADDYEDGEILMKSKGVMFQGKNMKGGKKKYFFHIDDK